MRLASIYYPERRWGYGFDQSTSAYEAHVRTVKAAPQLALLPRLAPQSNGQVVRSA